MQVNIETETAQTIKRNIVADLLISIIRVSICNPYDLKIKKIEAIKKTFRIIRNLDMAQKAKKAANNKIKRLSAKR